MLTDSPPRNSNRAGFLESDRVRTLDLPQDGRLLRIAKFIEGGMKAGNGTCPPRLRRVLGSHITVLQSFRLRCPSACSETATSAGTLDERTLRRLQRRDHADSCVDADGGAQGSHVIRYVPEYPVPRVLPPPRLPAVRVCGFMALAGLLRKGRRALSLCEGNAIKETILGSFGRWGAGELIGNAQIAQETLTRLPFDPVALSPR